MVGQALSFMPTTQQKSLALLGCQQQQQRLLYNALTPVYKKFINTIKSIPICFNYSGKASTPLDTKQQSLSNGIVLALQPSFELCMTNKLK